ncbi:hypothetical protein ACD591_02950 [Rufibacter glacialis]|uniref:STAS/SEC14 domain-containing protein n=1 Tax=Rufibacter glacialis TaxID=1259555 RepID=A0A5M8QI98_9BACT|nr:hypothetical protein [Rufibacter glacialis]KAA6435837.1 hypothetical protein FOE74_07855 [Rufibacter glacialis]GGK66989.1 hypothetical protein GCM10011405_13690 [Rufibacter glacialis]
MANIWAVTSAHSYISLAFEEDQDWVYVKWSGHIDADDVVAAATTYLTVQQEKRFPKLLNDKSEVTGEWEGANDWLEFDWMPQVETTGLKYFALVLSRDMHGLVTAQDLKRRLGDRCQVGLFYDLPSAQEWLASFATTPG